MSQEACSAPYHRYHRRRASKGWKFVTIESDDWPAADAAPLPEMRMRELLF